MCCLSGQWFLLLVCSLSICDDFKQASRVKSLVMIGDYSHCLLKTAGE